jgi:fumarylpyruvate hydrolase
MVVAIGSRGVRLAPADALAMVWGYAVGLDMTRATCRTRCARKSVRGTSEVIRRGGADRCAASGSADRTPQRGAIWLDVNGKRRQQGDLADMIWDVAHTVHFLSQYYELLPGDLIFTGTPAGVGAVVPGDCLDGGIDGLGTLSLSIEREIA